MVSPGCDTDLQTRYDWAIAYDIEQNDASRLDTPTEALRRMYTALQLCEDEVVRQSGQSLFGPKRSGVEPTLMFEPSGRETGTTKRRARSGRTLTCTNTAYDPAFVGGQVRTGGRSACNMVASLSATTCIGRYFHSTGFTDQQACNPGTVTASAITIYTAYVGCSSVISYRTNFYGVTGNAYSFYFNGAYNGCP